MTQERAWPRSSMRIVPEGADNWPATGCDSTSLAESTEAITTGNRDVDRSPASTRLPSRYAHLAIVFRDLRRILITPTDAPAGDVSFVLEAHDGTQTEASMSAGLINTSIMV